jgi:quercetin dioxygenase-like cupin family protein
MDNNLITSYNRKLLELQDCFKAMDQVEIPLIHNFAPGVYMRRILMPAETFLIGKTHKTEHLNIVFSGLAAMMINGNVRIIRGGDVFISKPGSKKVFHVLNEMVFGTIHATNETDIDKLEELCVLTDEEEKQALIRMESKLCLGQQ